MNSQAYFIKEICEEEGIQFECLSFGYVVRLSKDGKTRHIFGSFWDINSAASDRIACDKTACSLILSQGGVPVIPHKLVCNPLRRPGWSGENGAWARAANFFEKHNRKVVIKPNQGTMGQDVYLCETMPQLETAAHAIFQNHSDAALSPYREIENEYRVFYLNGRAMFSYGKTKGDTWQHNLNQGAKAFEVTDEKKIAALHNLATRAAGCIGITFATVDIALFPTGGISVMEINSGVQAKQLLEQLPHLRPTIKNIYANAARLLFI